jgi:hypothetical protein
VATEVESDGRLARSPPLLETFRTARREAVRESHDTPTSALTTTEGDDLSNASDPLERNKYPRGVWGRRNGATRDAVEQHIDGPVVRREHDDRHDGRRQRHRGSDWSIRCGTDRDDGETIERDRRPARILRSWERPARRR